MQIKQPLLLVDLQIVLGMLGEWVELMYGMYEVGMVVKKFWMFEG